MKKLLFFLLLILACNKYEMPCCNEDNFGYLSFTDKYMWYCFQLKGDTTLNYKYVWLADYETKLIKVSSGIYTIDIAEPYIKNEEQRELMMKNHYAPIPYIWSEVGSFAVKRCDTINVN